MNQLTPAGQNIINGDCARYGLSFEAVLHMLIAVNNGGGTMAQFNCPELGGGGQWMQGGMTMVGDMFNYGLKNTVNNLCCELSNALATTQIFPVPEPGTSGSWWPAGLGIPSSSGAQNNIRYSVFPQSQRLAIELGGQVTVYDTLDHNIGGVSQQQGGDTSLTFSSQYGTVAVNSLPLVSGPGMSPAPQTNFASPPPQNASQPILVSAPSSNTDSSDEILVLVEKMAQLRDAGVLTEDEFNTKKGDLLNRL